MTKPFKFFTGDDFKIEIDRDCGIKVPPSYDVCDQLADRANQLLNERGVVVFGDDRSGVWTDKATVTDTKEALLLPPRRMRCLDGK